MLFSGHFAVYLSSFHCSDSHPLVGSYQQEGQIGGLSTFLLRCALQILHSVNRQLLSILSVLGAGDKMSENRALALKSNMVYWGQTVVNNH